jgi:transcriptional regulator with XRE-family HTH domain
MINRQKRASFLRYLAAINEVSQTEVAEATGLSRSHISGIFSNRKTPSDEVKEKLCNYFGVFPDELDLFARIDKEEFMRRRKEDFSPTFYHAVILWYQKEKNNA